VTAVLTSVTDAVRAPGAAALSPDGEVRAATGEPAPGEDLLLTVSGQVVGALRVAARRSGEQYSASDRSLLGALAPQVAVVVRAMDLAEALEAGRDRVLAATRAERDRLRRDLHDGLGPSLSGVGLSLRALDDSLDSGDLATARQLNSRTREEVRSAVGEVRRILDDLRPGSLDEDGLASAVRRHAAISASLYPVHVNGARTCRSCDRTWRPRPSGSPKRPSRTSPSTPTRPTSESPSTPTTSRCGSASLTTAQACPARETATAATATVSDWYRCGTAPKLLKGP
jgi:hypothetical protein